MYRTQRLLPRMRDVCFRGAVGALLTAAITVSFATLVSCGEDSNDPPLTLGGGVAAAPGLAGRTGAGGTAGSRGMLDSRPGGAASVGQGGAGDTCASQNATAEVLPVRLAFAFDVSGSMGAGDRPWHDVTLKWNPVVAATRAFFEDPASTGLEASLTAFPAADSGARCQDQTYTDPTVPMTSLPSMAFGAALDAIRAAGWRGGTPTVHVVNGVFSFIDAYSATNRGRYVLVLVTDGYPQNCSDNDIRSVVDAVAARASRTPTYVIGIANPPLTDSDGNKAPETVLNLTQIAVAGKGEAFLIDTGSPAQTSAAFTAAMNRIRGAVAISCNLAIPPRPNGLVFERDKVAVTYRSGAAVTELVYDAACAVPNAWHYDDPSAPREIVLCDGSCNAVQADPAAVIDVTFTCSPVIDVPR